MNLIRQPGIICLSLYVFSVSIRLLYLYYVIVPAPLREDEPDYFELAEHLAAGDGYAKLPQQSQDGIVRLTAYRVPGPAAILAVPFLLFGPEMGVARWTSILFASLSSPLVYLLGRRIGSPPTALLAGLACSIYPSWVHYSTMIMSEAFYLPALLLTLLITDWLTREQSRWRWLTVGVTWGLLVLVRPHALPTCALLTLYWTCRIPFSRVVLVPLGVALVLGPWVLRNFIQVGHPVLLATEGGETLLGANNPDTLNDPEYYGVWKSPMGIPEYASRLKPIQDEVERDREQTRLAIEFFRSNPSSFPIIASRKFWRWVTPVTKSGGKNRILVLASYGTVLVLLLLGLVRGTFRRSQLLVYAVALTIASSVITAVYWGGLTRGRLPVEIIWLPWGSVSFWDAMCRLRRSRQDVALPVR